MSAQVIILADYRRRRAAVRVSVEVSPLVWLGPLGWWLWWAGRR